MRVAIWWIRRDLRLADNPALTAALAMADQVIPLFILDPQPRTPTLNHHPRQRHVQIARPRVDRITSDLLDSTRKTQRRVLPELKKHTNKT